MINIRKGKAPPSLVEFRETSSSATSGRLARYEDLEQATRQELVSRLLEEQGYLCCYCTARISADGKSRLRVEHWHCQSRYPQEQLDYGNMLAACGGNEGNGQPHCDVAKRDRDFVVNPSDPRIDIEEKLRYLGDGTLRSDDKILDQEINSILNLNLERLRQNRARVLRVAISELNKRDGTRSRSQIEKLLAVYTSVDKDGKFRPYAGVARYWLKKRLRRAR